MRAPWLAIALVLAGCGEDEEPTTSQQGRATPAAAPARAGAGSGSAGKQLTPQVHIEERVACRPPAADPKKACDPKAPACKDSEHCLLTSAGSFCGPCPERDGIRHPFKPRDFAATDNRDPFQSFTVTQVGMANPNEASLPKDPTQRCVRSDQLVATNFSYLDLKLVGIVAQGTQRKVLMMDTGAPPYGHIIKRGDCVGREKAVVKDIGTGYVTFEIPLEPTATGQPREPEQRSVQLHPRQLAVSAPPSDQVQPSSRTTITPVVAPPTLPPPASGAGSSGVRIVVPPTTPSVPVQPPPQAPTHLNP
ncbi:MAG: hypothetical protein ACTHU0_10850 [Kofleriaceae bacterium]